MAKKEKIRYASEVNEHGEVIRVRLPSEKEVIGLLDSRLGGSRSRVICSDGKIRICRIPGRLRRDLWVRPGDYVLVEPWEFGGDEKGDIIYKYKKSQIEWLRKHGYLKSFEELNEF